MNANNVEVGRLNERVEVLGLLKTTDEAGAAYTWEPVRRTWATSSWSPWPSTPTGGCW